MPEAARIWVVDDDRAVRFVLATALHDAGFEVTGFAAAGEVLDALQRATREASGAPALVVTDVRMPGDSGLVLLDKLKQQWPDLPVIVMSAHTDVASTAGAFRGGAHEFLSKPFDLDEAVALVRRALPQRDARSTGAPPYPAVTRSIVISARTGSSISEVAAPAVDEGANSVINALTDS